VEEDPRCMRHPDEDKQFIQLWWFTTRLQASHRVLETSLLAIIYCKTLFDLSRTFFLAAPRATARAPSLRRPLTSSVSRAVGRFLRWALSQVHVQEKTVASTGSCVTEV